MTKQKDLTGKIIEDKKDEVIHTEKTTKILITIKTKFKPQIDKEEKEDWKEEIQNRFHSEVYDFLEKRITDDYCLEEEVLEGLNEEFPFEFEEFQELGQIAITIQEEKVIT